MNRPFVALLARGDQRTVGQVKDVQCACRRADDCEARIENKADRELRGRALYQEERDASRLTVAHAAIRKQRRVAKPREALTSQHEAAREVRLPLVPGKRGSNRQPDPLLHCWYVSERHALLQFHSTRYDRRPHQPSTANRQKD